MLHKRLTVGGKQLREREQRWSVAGRSVCVQVKHDVKFYFVLHPAAF